MNVTYSGFSTGFGLFQGMFTIVFLLVIGVFIVGFIRGLGTWRKNNHAPRLTVEAKVVSRRTNITHHHGAGERDHHSTSTHYYATFEVESGDRMEFSLSGSEYGMIVEGDRGKLHFQGTRFLSFERI